MKTSSLFELALARLRAGRVLGGALSGTVLLTLPSLTACLDPTPTTGMVESNEWAQYEGVRDTRMISYTGQSSSHCENPNTRFGCGATAITVKLRVQPIANADLAWKRVGIVYHLPGDSNDQTAVGAYVTTNGDGTEEWDVTTVVQPWQTVVLFDAWYQDGLGKTWIDDNQGELHVVNIGPDYQVVRVQPWNSTVTVGDAGVQGQVSAQLTDLDYDKDVEIVATSDGWQSVLRFGIGASGDTNKWYWVEDLGPAFEHWRIDLDVPGAADHFEYAVLYRHGVVNNATPYSFWDNNGGTNYQVDRVTP
ncbi:MAG: hypothetical protein ABI467_10465 [Kofleriaceae bacterium]